MGRPHLTPRARRLLGSAAIVVLVTSVAALGAIAGSGAGLLYLVPTLALLGVLALSRYPGERALLAVIARRRARRRRHVAVCPLREGPPRPRLARGGALIASSLAVRPPPALAVAAIC